MKEIRVCASCGYGRGFHVFFRQGAEGEGARIGLICPGCGQSYEIGWLTPAPPEPPVPGEVFPTR